MASKTFVTISQKECSAAYVEILSNADIKWDSGIKLAEIKDYGSATSFAIISTEELVKALIIFLDSKGFEFRKITGMKAFFDHHQIRYLLAFGMFAMGVFGEELIKLILKIKANPEEIQRLIKEFKKPSKSFKRKIAFYIFRKFILLKREFKWFAKVNLYRQDGFYSDYSEELKTPIKISKTDYKKVFERLERVRMITKEFIKAYDNIDGSLEEHFQRLKSDLKNKKYYEKLGDSLAILRQNRENPFVTIQRKFPKLG